MPDPRLIDEAGRAEQKRIADYFRRSVVPQLRRCYAELSPGKVEFRYRFSPGEDSMWVIVPEDVDLHDSTLPDDEDEIALQCMRDAVTGTGFAMMPHEVDEEGYMIYWTWRTPPSQ